MKGRSKRRKNNHANKTESGVMMTSAIVRNEDADAPRRMHQEPARIVNQTR
jgi:hypothetical protein